MGLENNIIGFVAGFIILDLILLRRFYYPWLMKKAQKGKRAMWGNMLIVFGGIMASMGILFLALFLFSKARVDPAIILAFTSPLIVAIPSLIVGIFLVNNP